MPFLKAENTASPDQSRPKVAMRLRGPLLLTTPCMVSDRKRVDTGTNFCVVLTKSNCFVTSEKRYPITAIIVNIKGKIENRAKYATPAEMVGPFLLENVWTVVVIRIIHRFVQVC